MDIDKLLTAANKKEVRSRLEDYMQAEIRSLSREFCRNRAKKWFKENHEAIEENFNKEMSKIVPRMIREMIDNLTNPYR